MSEDPALAYFREIMEPAVAEFLADTSDKRRGCLASLAVASMTEHFFHARPDLAATGMTLGRFKGDIRDGSKPGGNAAIGWIADVANATKHVNTYGSRPGYAQVNSVELGAANVGSADWPLDGEEVVVGDPSCPDWRLSNLIESAMEFWQAKLLAPQASGPR